MAERWMLGETAALDDYIPTPPSNMLGEAAQGVKDWYTSQPSWLDRAQAENQKTTEAFQRGGMGEIARQLATDTTEAQDLAAGFGGNIKGVKPPVAPGALAAISEYRPPFYSAVEQAVQGAKQNVAPGQQWAGFLRNQPGVKPEEVEALKLGKLFEQPGSVPKEAVLGEIAANRVNVGEVYKGGPDSFRIADLEAERAIVRQQLNEARSQIARGQGPGGREGRVERVRELADQDQALTNQMIEASGSPAKFEQYTLPGGENYREMLLTLPTEDAPKAARMTALEGKLRNAGDYDTHEVNAMRREYKQLADETRASGTFKSPHYDEPNILAHVRYNDRVIDGKKTLFVEEVQSDWHQKGKREGYASDAQSFEVLDSEGNIIARTKTRQEAKNIADEEFDQTSIRAVQGKTGVPDAPFKTTWPELAMKRIIREAAEKGYDKVAWTPGSVQADRYDLSKHIKRITLEPSLTGGGSEYLAAYDHSGKRVIDKIVTREEMPDLIGKDMADKLINQPKKKIPAQLGLPGSTTPIRELSGLDLKVGGEGMKGFYDEILPAAVNRLVKKHGGRVMQSDMTAASAASPERVHTLDITPSLRAAAMKGFPLFTAGGVAATGVMGEMARQDEYR